MKTFKFTPKQQLVLETVSSTQSTHQMLFGGSRSAKTFLHIRNIVLRALKAPGSRHVVVRFRFNHCKQSIGLDTFPKVMELCFKGVRYNIDKSDWYAKFDNGSEIWFGGLDDKERTEKILGKEFATIFLNECSQISWYSVGIVKTRLAQQVTTKIEGRADKPLKLRMYYDCNPPSKAHWTYLIFIRKVDPDTKKPLVNPDNYVCEKMSPKDNIENLPQEYLDELQNLPARLRKRFWDGDFADATPNQLFIEETIEKWRNLEGDNLPDFIRVVIGVDPSGADDEDNADNDEIGIIVGALGTDGNAYLLEDCTVKAGPATWGRIAANAWERHSGDCIVAEQNYGGAMVKQVIKTANSRIPYRKATATRGKAVRAEPFSALYEQGKVRHVGHYPELENELVAFSTIGYMGDDSPNRADAWIWVLSELFPGLIKTVKKKEQKREVTGYRDYLPNNTGWMG